MVALVGPLQGGPGGQNVHLAAQMVVLSLCQPREAFLGAPPLAQAAAGGVSLLPTGRSGSEGQAQAARVPKGSWFYSIWKLAHSALSARAPPAPLLPHCAREGERR